MKHCQRTAQYFSHYAHDSNAEYLWALFKQDGYVLYNRLREMLCDTHGHCIDIRNNKKWLIIIQDKCNIQPDRAMDILRELADVGFIDKDLLKKGIIWSDSFVAELKGLYARRKSDLPVRPDATTLPVMEVMPETPPTIIVEPKQPSEPKRKPKRAKKMHETPDNPLFEEFWAAYPARKGKKLDKAEAITRFMALTEPDRLSAISAARNFANSSQVKEGFGIKDPKRFLNDSWRDWIEPEKATPQGNVNDKNYDGEVF